MAFKMKGPSLYKKNMGPFKPMASVDPADVSKREREIRPDSDFTTFGINKLPTIDLRASDDVKYTTKTKTGKRRNVTKYFDPKTGKKLGKKVEVKGKDTKVKATTDAYLAKDKVDKDYFKGTTKEENTKKKLRKEKRDAKKAKRASVNAKREEKFNKQTKSSFTAKPTKGKKIIRAVKTKKEGY